MHQCSILWHFPTFSLLTRNCDPFMSMSTKLNICFPEILNCKMNYQCLLADTQLASFIHIFAVISHYSSFSMCCLPQDFFIMLMSLLFYYACKSFCKRYLPQSTSIHLSKCNSCGLLYINELIPSLEWS